jgi:hypothetical protein
MLQISGRGGGVEEGEESEGTRLHTATVLTKMVGSAQ